MSQLVVLCGGIGTRMASVTGAGQKCTVPVAGRPFLGHVLDRAARPPVDHVLLLAGHAAGQVRDFARAWRPPLPCPGAGGSPAPPRVDVLVEAAPAGPVGALREAMPHLDEEFLLVLGDVLPPDRADLYEVLTRTLHRTRARAVMAVAPESRSRDQGNVSIAGPWITRYAKGPALPYIDRGVRFLRRSALRSEAGDSDVPFFGALAAGRRLTHWICDEPIIEVGTPDRWRHACAALTGPPPGPSSAHSRAEGRSW
ncbi:hypothetical protein C3492_10605 [Streptomyces sp. Ru62]|uniref:NTP transferase domain-containing protein n=1 Tax=Streptomyces sp. Ru62 TaxID=2080745 RepID=UPI000CDCEF73|nr:NTP transferase domain-containing protein [Streptomyces sp. Ru62]POX63584.1 hypothetical protein C3492_10605 [Streptomyces sp. Ru62]